MNLKRLARRVRKQTRRAYRRGEMTREQAGQAMAVAADPKALVALNTRIEAEVNPWNQPGLVGKMDWGTFFKNAWDWFVENWPKILEIILTIAPLLLLEPRYADL